MIDDLPRWVVLTLYTLEIGSLILSLVIFIGSVTFLWQYRPHNPRLHSPAGRHLQAMGLALAVLFGSEVLTAVLFLLGIIPGNAIPSAAIQFTALSFVAYTVWDRVRMRRAHQRHYEGKDK